MDHPETAKGAPVRRGAHPGFTFDQAWLDLHVEETLLPDLPIIDPHHHFWDRGQPYWVPELVADIRDSGHNIRSTVYVEAGSMYPADDKTPMAVVGEVEFVNGIGAAFASGYHGDLRLCAGIVGRADLGMGAAVAEVLATCQSRAPNRYRGIRQITAFDDSPGVSRPSMPIHPGMMREAVFQQGFATLGQMGLSFDAMCYHPQLPDLMALCDSAPDTVVIVNHCGMPLGEGAFAGRRAEVFETWRGLIRQLAERPNVYVKLGGMNGRLYGFPFIDRDMPPNSTELAEAWRPYVETCIEAFGVDHSMFESNLPPDRAGCSPGVLWNAFKRLADGCSPAEMTALFSGAARQAYRLPPV